MNTNDEILKITRIPNEFFEFWNNFWKFGIIKERVIDIGIILKKWHEDSQIHLFFL